MDVPEDVMLLDFVPRLEEAFADFGLSLLDDAVQQFPVNAGNASSPGCSVKLMEIFPDFSTGFGRCVSKSDSLSLRVSSIEECLGIYHVAVWGVKVDNIIPIFATCCSDIFGCSVSVLEFSVVHRLDTHCTGFLLAVSILVLKRTILLKAADVQLRGLFVGIC